MPLLSRPLARTPGWAIVTCGVYLALALVVRGGVPFVRFPAFQFPVADGATAVPIFLADGERRDITAYAGFQGVDPGAVDVTHHGVGCSVEHLLYEQRQWLAGHLAPEGEPPGPVRAEIGLEILSVGPSGRLETTTRIDATGTAHVRAP